MSLSNQTKIADLPSLPSIEEINRSNNKDDFCSYMLPLFEKSPKLIDSLYGSLPFNSYQDMMKRAEEIVLKEFTTPDKINVINSHPRLGSNISQLSDLSKIEQSHSSGTSNSSEQLWPKLNQKYEEKFGFRFVIFVNKRPISELVPVIEKIIADPKVTKDSEIERALNDFLSIAKDRLKLLVKQS